MCDLGYYSDALKIGNELLNIYNSPTGFYVLGLVYTLLENYPLAIENGVKTYQYFPLESNNLNRLGISYCSLGHIEQGLNYFKIGLELGDSNCRQNFNYWVSKI